MEILWVGASLPPPANAVTLEPGRKGLKILPSGSQTASALQFWRSKTVTLLSLWNPSRAVPLPN